MVEKVRADPERLGCKSLSLHLSSLRRFSSYVLTICFLFHFSRDLLSSRVSEAQIHPSPASRTRRCGLSLNVSHLSVLSNLPRHKRDGHPLLPAQHQLGRPRHRRSRPNHRVQD